MFLSKLCISIFGENPRHCDDGSNSAQIEVFLRCDSSCRKSTNILVQQDCSYSNEQLIEMVNCFTERPHPVGNV